MRQTSIQKNLERKELFVFDQIIFLAVNSSIVGGWRNAGECYNLKN